MKQKTIKNIIDKQKDENVALTSEKFQPLKYGELKKLVNKIARQLSSQGISNKDRAAIVLPNGPHMATSFLAISSFMSAAPLNPAYKTEEYEFYLNDLKPKIVLVEPNSSNKVLEAAKRLKIPICELKIKSDSSSGMFDLFENESKYDLPNENDEALVLHTSGTTSRPKMVPLSQKNLLASASNISNTLNLSEEDKCLNIMPMFHIHGLIAAILAPIYKSGTIIIPSGFDALKFFRWIDK